MRHLLGEAELTQGGDAVSAANHHGRAGISLLGGNLGELAGGHRKRWDLKDAEWSVPQDGLDWRERLANRSNGVGAKVNHVPARWELVGGDHLELGAARDLFSHHAINREKHAYAAVLCQLQNASRIVDHLRLVEALPHTSARGHKEGVRNTTAKDQQVNLLDQRLEDGHLARDLAAANDRGEWSRRLVEQIGERLHLLLHEQANVRRQVGGDADSAGVGAVRRTECVVHEDIAIRGEPLRKRRIVALLASVEADVLK